MKASPTSGSSNSQTLDEQFRSYLGIGDEEKGVFVASVREGASAEKAGIEAGDVLLSVNGHEIDARGNYNDPYYGLLNLSHLVRGDAQVGDEVEIVVLRDGKRKKLKAKLRRKAPEDYLVDPYMFDRGGKYLLMGGLLFQELTRPYLQSYGKEWQTRAAAEARLRHEPPREVPCEEGRRKLVFLAGVLPTESVQGYERVGGLIVRSVNGREIKDIRDLDLAFNHPDEKGLHEIRFATSSPG